MICPKCGATIEEGKRVCEFCGAEATQDMIRQSEVARKEGCPKCGSTNIKFDRENQGEIRGKNTKRIVHKTVGFCKDCGYTWYPGEAQKPKKNTGKLILWILGWIYIFPVPLTIILLRKKEMKPWLKYGLIGLAWGFMLLIWISLGSSESETDNSKDTTAIERTADVTKETAANADKKSEEIAEKNESDLAIYPDYKVVDLMSGDGSRKIGTITVTSAEEATWNDDTIVEWFTNVVKENETSNYHIVVYSDNPSKGIYALSKGTSITKDENLIKESNGSYSIGNDNGASIYVFEEENKTLKLLYTMASEKVVNEVTRKIHSMIPNEYKKTSAYAVDIAGPEDALDCNITLVNEEFEEADYQSIAIDLANQLVDNNLGIGYLNIVFQTDIANIKAFSTVDLSAQEPSEMQTKLWK